MITSSALEARLKDMKNYIDTEEFKALREQYTANMSRTQRRAYQRREEKMIKCIKALTPSQMELIDEISNMKMENKFNETNLILDRCISALLSTLFEEKDWGEILEVEDILTSLIIEDTEKTQNIKKECKGDMEMANKKIEKYEKEVQAKIEELLGTSLKQKEIIEILVTQFPTLSKSMLTNAYKKMKSAWDKEHKHEDLVEKDPEVQEAAEKILGIIEDSEGDKKADKEFEQATKIVCTGNNCSVVTENKSIENKEESKVKGLKVLEEKVVKTIKVEGENGVYEGKTGEGIILSRKNASIRFENEEQLDEWVSEFKKVFEMVK